MDNNQKDQNKDPENIEQRAVNPDPTKTTFNAGSNDSDYDGGHPEGGPSKSGERNESSEQQERQDSNGKPFNSGGNDSDYDGGHP